MDGQHKRQDRVRSEAPPRDDLPVLLRLPNLRRNESGRPELRVAGAEESSPPTTEAATEAVDQSRCETRNRPVVEVVDGEKEVAGGEEEPLARRLSTIEGPCKPPFDRARDNVRNQNAFQYVVACSVVVAVVAAAIVTRRDKSEPQVNSGQPTAQASQAEAEQPAMRPPATSWQLPNTSDLRESVASPATEAENLSRAPMASPAEMRLPDAQSAGEVRPQSEAVANMAARLSMPSGESPYPHTRVPAMERGEQTAAAYTGPRAAEFEGTITAPAYRVENDRDRPSVY